MPSKDAFYFSHDANARNDIKIIKLRRKLGMAGYGIYWCVIEILRETSEYKLPIEHIDDIAFELKVESETLTSIINDFGLFTVNDGFFCSTRLCKSMGMYNDYRDKLSAAGKKGMEKRWGNNKGGMVI